MLEKFLLKYVINKRVLLIFRKGSINIIPYFTMILTIIGYISLSGYFKEV